MLTIALLVTVITFAFAAFTFRNELIKYKDLFCAAARLLERDYHKSKYEYHPTMTPFTSPSSGMSKYGQEASNNK